MKKIPNSITSTLDTIAHYLSLYGQSYTMWWDFYQIDFKFNKKSDLLLEEIEFNDNFWILKDETEIDEYEKTDKLLKEITLKIQEVNEIGLITINYNWVVKGKYDLSELQKWTK